MQIQSHLPSTFLLSAEFLDWEWDHTRSFLTSLFGWAVCKSLLLLDAMRVQPSAQKSLLNSEDFRAKEILQGAHRILTHFVHWISNNFSVGVLKRRFLTDLWNLYGQANIFLHRPFLNLSCFWRVSLKPSKLFFNIAATLGAVMLSCDPAVSWAWTPLQVLWCPRNLAQLWSQMSSS